MIIIDLVVKMFRINFRDTKVLQGKKLFSLMKKVLDNFNMTKKNFIVLNKKTVRDYKCVIHSCCFDNHPKKISCLENLLEISHLVHFSCKEICDLVYILNSTEKFDGYENICYHLMNLVKKNQENLKQYLSKGRFLKLIYFDASDSLSLNGQEQSVSTDTLSTFYERCILFREFNFYMTSFVAIVYPNMSKCSFKKTYCNIFGEYPHDIIVENLKKLNEYEFIET